MKQNDSRRRPKKPITFKGETKSQAEWAKELGLHPGTIARRIRLGLPLEKVHYTGKLSSKIDDPMRFISVTKRPYQVTIRTTEETICKTFETLEEAQVFRDDQLLRLQSATE